MKIVKNYISQLGVLPIVLCILFSLSYMLKSLGGIGDYSLYLRNYSIILGFLFFIVGAIAQGINRVYLPILFFLYIQLLSIAINNPLQVFRSWERLFLFVILLCAVFPIFSSDVMRKMRELNFNMMCFLCMLISVISFFCYFLGINMMTDHSNEIIDDYIGHGGWFSGITNQSMMLAPISGVGACYALVKTFKNKDFLYLLLFFFCYASMLFAASRVAFAGLNISALFIVFSFIKKSKRNLRLMGGALFLLLLTFRIWSGWLVNLENKIEKNNALYENLFDARGNKYKYRVAEFKQSPIFGIGFAAVDPHNSSEFMADRGSIEPGSSWLAILSMSGILGAICMIKVFWDAFFCTFRRKDDRSILIFALLLFFVVHMVAEGYIFAAGSSLCYLLWTTLGSAINRKLYN